MKILLREVRKDKKNSIRMLAERSGWSKSTISNIEMEKTSPTLDQLEAFAEALQVNITDLFDSPYK